MPNTSKPFPPSFHLLLVVAVGLLFWAYWPEWTILWQTWQSDPDYNHGFLVIPISGWLLWQQRASLASIEVIPSWWGIGLILVAGLLRWVGAEFFIPQIETWSIPVWVAGVVLLFGGWPLLRWSGGAIAFLWFMTPLPDSMIGFVSLPLQKISAALSTWTLHLFAQPAVRFGTTISLGEHVLEVERACSGLRVCYGIMALAVAYVVLMRPRLIRAVILLSLSLPVAIIANSARVTATGLLFLIVSGEQAHQYAHDFSGILMMPFAAVLLWLAHLSMEKLLGAFEVSPKTGNMLVLKSGLVMLLFATGMVLWQRRQSDAAVGTLLKISERHESNAHGFQEERKAPEAAREWVEAITVLDRYCRVRPDDVSAALQLAKISEQLAFTNPWRIRSARYYERAWSLKPDDLELGIKQAQLALAGEDFQLALGAAAKLLLQTAPDSPTHLDAFKLKVQAETQDAERLNARTSWNQVSETLKHGIDRGLDDVMCAYQLAVLYRRHPISSIAESQRDVAAEQVLSELLARRADDPIAWFARFAFRQVFGAPDAVPAENSDPDRKPGSESVDVADSDPGTPPASQEKPTIVPGAPFQSADEDLDRAIELATPKITSETHPLWLAAGNRELARKNFPKAREYFRQAIHSKPSHFLAYLQAARAETSIDGGHSGQEVQPDQREAAIKILKEGLSQKELSDDMALKVELIRQQLQTQVASHVAEANAEIMAFKSQFKTLPPEIGVPLELELITLESQIYAAAGDFEKAARILDAVLTSKEVLAMKTGSGLLSSSWIALGSYYEQQGLTEKARRAFAQATTLEPSSIPTVMFQAYVAERDRNASVAADLYEDIAPRLGNRPEPWLALARNELRQQLARDTAQRDFSRLNTALEKATASGAPEIETAVIYSEIAAARQDAKLAITILEKVAARYPDSADVWRRLALRRQAAGDSAGAKDALSQYQTAVRNPLEAVLLEAELLIFEQKFDDARQALSVAMQTVVDVEGQRRLQEQLVRIELLIGRPVVAQELLEQFAAKHPNDIKARTQLANLYYGLRRFDMMEQTEQELKKLEGEYGTTWQNLRARRLIQLAGQSTIASERGELLTEAKSLVDALVTSSANSPGTQALQGQLALQEGRSADAAQYFEAAWTRGDRTALLATELIYALQASGDAKKAEYFLGQMQNLLPASPQLFDMALANHSILNISDLNRSTEIVQNWVQSIADADSYLRLARTLQLKKVTSEPRRTQWLQETEMAYRKSMEIDPRNTQAWGEYLRFLNSERKDPGRTIAEMNEFARTVAISELDRSFVTSLLLAELNLKPQAGRYWNSTIELTQKSTDPKIQNRVLMMAAQFFAGQDLPRATQLARQAVAVNPNDATSLRLLIALLSDANSADSLKEASKLLKTLSGINDPSANQLAQDSAKRIEASVLYRRAVLLPDEFNAAEDLLSAAELLRQMKPPTDADAVQLARIVAAQGDKQAALRAFSEQARRIGASVSTVRVFVEYWQDHFAGTEVMRDRVEQALQSLEEPSGSPITALDLRLRPASLNGDEKVDIVRQFVTRVIAPATAPQLQDGLLLQLYAFLSQKGLSAVSLQLLADELPPLTIVQKLNALILVTTQTPGSFEFETTLSRTLETQLPIAKNAELDRAAADFYFMRASWDAAEPCYRRCLQQDPNDIGAANNLALVVTESRQDFDEAERLIKQSLEIVAKSPASAGNQTFLLDTQSQILLSSGKSEQALEILIPLSQSVAADASVYLHLAECYRLLNKTEESQQAFAIAQRLGISTSILPPMDKRMYDALAASGPEKAALRQ